MSWRRLGVLIRHLPRGSALHREMDPIVRDPEYKAQLRQYGFTVNSAGNAKYIGDFIRDRREAWDRVVKTLNIQPQ